MNMGTIINFWEAKRAIEMGELRERLEHEYDKKQAEQWENQKKASVDKSMVEAIKYLAKPPAKRARIISALPGETIPSEHEDLRPCLQHNGLILLSWAIWENYDSDGLAIRVNWIKSSGKLKNIAVV